MLLAEVADVSSTEATGTHMEREHRGSFVTSRQHSHARGAERRPSRLFENLRRRVTVQKRRHDAPRPLPAGQALA